VEGEKEPRGMNILLTNAFGCIIILVITCNAGFFLASPKTPYAYLYYAIGND